MKQTTILLYKDWVNTTEGVQTNEQDSYAAYLEYVHAWYDTTFEGKSTKELSSDEYATFLSTLKIVSNDSDVNSFIDNLNYENENEIEIAIPILSKTLRDTARYISRKRDESKYTADDYKYINSNLGLSSSIYRAILEQLISSDELTVDEFINFIEGMTVNIEELYDDNQYHDKIPNKPASEYFNIAQNSTYYGNCGTEYMDWAIGSGFNDLHSNNDSINPPVSGVLPLSGYLNYTPDSEQVTHYQGNLSVHTTGEEHYFISADEKLSLESYSSVVNPWNNLSNRYYPTIAVLPLVDSLYSKAKIGSYMVPSKLGMPVAIGRNKFHNPTEEMIDSDNFGKLNSPNLDLYSNGYSFTNNYQNGFNNHNSYLNWIDIRQSSGAGRGILANSKKYQEMVPYQTTSEGGGHSNLGISQIHDSGDPWYLTEDKVWEDMEEYPPDFRNIYDSDKWYAENVRVLDGVEDQWCIDMYGNNYALYKTPDGNESDFNNSFIERERNTTGVLYVRSNSGLIVRYSEFFKDSLDGDSAFISLRNDNLKSFNVYNNIVVMVDDNDNFLIQTIDFEDGVYKIAAGLTKSSFDIDQGATSHNYSHLDYCFDNRDNSLYIGRHERIGWSGSYRYSFTIYKYNDGILSSIYDLDDDNSNDVLRLNANYDIRGIIDFSKIKIDPDSNTLYVAYRAVSIDVPVILIFPMSLSGSHKLGEIIIVEPTITEYDDTDPLVIEDLCLIDIMIGENIIIILEGSDTRSKYLEVIPL